ncbi:hypothetical protein [Roseomonas rosulenta]|nr:hypothetical protein [Roseomonas rosulenta]
MPLPRLVERLEEITQGRLLRSDRRASAGIEGLREEALFFDFPP